MSNSNIYTVGGTVQAGGGIYIKRKADDDLLQLCRQADLAFILFVPPGGQIEFDDADGRAARGGEYPLFPHRSQQPRHTAFPGGMVFGNLEHYRQ